MRWVVEVSGDKKRGKDSFGVATGVCHDFHSQSFGSVQQASAKIKAPKISALSAFSALSQRPQHMRRMVIAKSLGTVQWLVSFFF